VPPLNLIGDFGGGGMLLGFGIACALLEARRSGQGQVVDAAMIDGTALLAAMFSGLLAAGSWSETRGDNILDTGAPWYDVYETKDGKYVSIGAIEGRFYEELLERLQLKDLPDQYDRARWPEMKEVFSKVFRTRSREEWCRVFDGSDACFAPVLSWSEARAHPQSVSRKSYLSVGNVPQPAPAPRFSRTPGAVRHEPPQRGEGGLQALRDWGFAAQDIDGLKAQGLGTRE
jgi:alpha-methylacyl-CoA racemase